jgi:NAD(P)-dependent dehydrogenase (short-subunit alcohol dehydrogenase family)
MTLGGNWKDLLKTARDGDIANASYHLRCGVDPNFQHPEYFTAPLFEALRAGHVEMVKMLVEEGKADPGLTEELTGDNAIEIALSSDSSTRYEILDYLNSKLPKEKQHVPRRILVTCGGRIGKEICRQLLLKGHIVVFICDCEETALATKKELNSTTGNPKVDVIVGALDTVRSVKAVANEVRKKMPTLNTLIHTASLWSTQKIINDDGLELSFMVNYMARYVLSKELMPLLNNNGPAHVIFVSPESVAPIEPDLNVTPYGHDFHFRSTFSKTITCGTMAFLNIAQNVKDSLTVTFVEAGGAYNAMSRPLNGCSACVMGIIKLFWEDSPTDAANEPVWLLEMEQCKNIHGKLFTGQKEFSNMQDLPVPREWEEWTNDFLSRSSLPQ